MNELEPKQSLKGIDSSTGGGWVKYLAVLLRKQPIRGGILRRDAFSHRAAEIVGSVCVSSRATQSLRLWRYQKDRAPYSKASPKSATTYERYFQHPDNTDVEGEIETGLARNIEGPVNQFLDDLCEPGFLMNERQRESMTRYVSLLFSRSLSRRQGSRHIQDLIRHALQKFLENEGQILTVAAQWSLEQTFKGDPMWVARRYVKRVAQQLLNKSRLPSSEQANFVTTIRNSMNRFDDKMFRGEWRMVTTSLDKPFIISDTPVVTWQGLQNGEPSYGIGFERPDVEVVLPISPTVCLRILPRVHRTREVLQPTIDEINKAQAAYAFSACYAHRHSVAIDEIVQMHVSTAKIGQNVFTLWHRNYDSLFYDALLGQSPFR